MTGIVDVGGGLRGIYGAGVLDYCLDHGITFPYCIGVSAGSANLASYLAGQRGRNYRFYTEYSLRREYISFGNLLHKGSYVDLDYAYSVLTNSDGENPLDYGALAANPARFEVVATDARTGRAVYFGRADLGQNDYDIFKASSCLPVLCPPYYRNGVPYYDGGIADPIPIERAFACGCDKVAVILTRPFDYVRTAKRDKPLCRLLRRKYPETARALALRYKTYNDSIVRLRQYKKEGRAMVIAPDDCCGMETLTRDAGHMKQLYDKGYRDAQRLTAPELQAAR